MSNNATRTQVVVVRCLDCGERIQLRSNVYIGKEIICPNCDTELEVVNTDPIQIDWLYEDDDDQDQDDDDW